MYIHLVLILNPWLVGGLFEIHCQKGLLATRSNGQTCLLKTFTSGGYSKDHLPCQESCARDGGHGLSKDQKPPCDHGVKKKLYTHIGGIKLDIKWVPYSNFE